MELSAYLQPLRRWWWLVLASAILAGASGYWQVSQQPPLYEARTTLMVGRAFEDPNPTGNELALSRQLAETYADLVQRRPIREQTMLALGLASLPAYTARPLPNGQLLEIVVVDTTPPRAKAVADELANQLILQSPTAPRPEDQERQAFISDQLASLQTNIRQTEAEITAKQAELETAIGALEISQIEDEIGALQTKQSTLQSNYAALLANTHEGATNSVNVVEWAIVPESPMDAGRTNLVVVAVAIAVALAAGAAYLLEHLDDTVRTSDDLGRVRGLATLPGIPRYKPKDGAIAALSQNGQRSPVIDAFRALCTSVYAARADKRGNVFLITSSAPQEGKSVIVANLAVVLAQSGKSVLLIDADLHQPVQHTMFGVTADYGLAELLTAAQGQLEPNEMDKLIQCAIQAGPSGLSLIVAGTERADATRLLGAAAMKRLLETVSAKFEYVIVDSPPVLAVADALTLSRQVDGVVLVAGAGSTARRRLEHTLRRLTDVDANVIGAVLNRQPMARNGYYARYYHA